jgi:uncharacterized damage-inducible protein DinB
LTVERLFLEFSINKIEQLHSRIRECLNKLGEDEIWARGAENENAIGNLVLHLTGNVRQWIVAGVGGEADTRLRDQEFTARGDTHKQELVERLEATLAQAKNVLENMPPARLTARVTIQKYDVTVLDAIYHVVEHFSQHTGQIIFATKMLTGDDLGFYKHLKAAAHAETTP